jgi:hypothetical protein
MAIKVDLNFKWKRTEWKSGHIYTFKYHAWHNDPQPTVILMYRLFGMNPKSGHFWRLIQCINFTYIPRPMRQQFASTWVQTMERTGGNAAFTWQLCKRRFPYLKHAVRRYLIKPDYYITNVKAIPLEDMESVIVSTWSKDFSKKLRTDLIQKYRKVMDKKKKTGGFMSRIKGFFGG